MPRTACQAPGGVRSLRLWPIPRPNDWGGRVNGVLTKKERETVQASVIRGRPYGSGSLQEAIGKQLGLDSTFHPRGRPKNTIDDRKSKIIGLIPFLSTHGRASPTLSQRSTQQYRTRCRRTRNCRLGHDGRCGFRLVGITKSFARRMRQVEDQH